MWVYPIVPTGSHATLEVMSVVVVVAVIVVVIAIVICCCCYCCKAKKLIMHIMGKTCRLMALMSC